jgi:small subunit ribosomal protein S18
LPPGRWFEPVSGEDRRLAIAAKMDKILDSPARTIFTESRSPASAMPPYNNDRNDRNKRNKNIKKVAKRDPLYVDGQAPRPMYVDYKDLDLLTKLTNRHGRIVSRRKTGCHAASQHAVARAIKRARFMALLPYVGD